MTSALADLVRRHPAPSAFTGAHIAVFTAIGIALERPFLWVYLPLMVASIAAVVVVDRKAGPLPGAVLWLLSVWGALHLAGGLVGDPSGRSTILYNWWLLDGWLRYDQVVHGFGIAVVTVALAHAARRRERPVLRGFVWGQAIGVGNEVVENVFARLVEGSNVGDAVNTAWDLGWHVIGGAAAVVWMWRVGFPRSDLTRPG
jgi:hypothetical protein